MVVGCLGLAAIPLIAGNPSANPRAKNARKMEAEAVANATKTQLRAMYARTGTAPESYDSTVRDMLNTMAGEHISSVSYKKLSDGGTYNSSQHAEGEITVHMSLPDDGTYVMSFDFDSGTDQSRWQP